MARKLPKEVKEQRLDDVREMYARAASSGRIVEELGKRWKVGPRAIYPYIAVVHAEMSKYGASLPQGERKFYESTVIRGLQKIAEDSMAEAAAEGLSANQCVEHRRVAMFALEKLGKAINMYREKIEVSGAGGGPLALTIEDARKRVETRLEDAIKRTTAARAP